MKDLIERLRAWANKEDALLVVDANISATGIRTLREVAGRSERLSAVPKTWAEYHDRKDRQYKEFVETQPKPVYRTEDDLT